ncbi:hypothetical protein [Ruegeria arenilitoris]|uniref:hypothetical protein n=1 Tax=Ruegeria arenilitoris TaxID=1173585 RepID=UPI00147CF88B|nr:hypothetical protein [Ruegeria arenilitoris]
MTDSRLVGMVTALLFLATSGGARAEITLEHLLAIDQLLSSNDTKALQSYLDRNPELLAGEDELSRELREFYNAASSGNLNFGFPANASPDPRDAQTGTAARSNELQH